MLAPRLFTENNVFDDFFNDFGFAGAFNDINRRLYGKHAAKEMLTDVHDKDDHYELLVDLPGFHKDNIRIELADGYLTITTEKGLEEKDDDNTGKLVRQERWYGTMSRSFYVGDNIRNEEVTAKFDGGVLTVNVPKKDVQKALPETKRIMIE